MSETLIHPIKIGTNGASFRQPYVETDYTDVSSSAGVIVPGRVTTSIDVCVNNYWTKLEN